MKTKLSDGIIMFGGVPEGEWIVIELVDGIVRYSTQLDGRSGLTRTMNLPLPEVEQSHTWHDVTIQRLSPNSHLLRVDNVSTADMMPSSTRPVRSPRLPLTPPVGDLAVPITPAVVADVVNGFANRRQLSVLMLNHTTSLSPSLTNGVFAKHNRTARSPEQISDILWSMTSTGGADNLFIGGLPNALLKSFQSGSIQSHDGFQGCLASINLNGDGRSLRSRGYHVPEEHRHDVIEGCEGKFKINSVFDVMGKKYASLFACHVFSTSQIFGCSLNSVHRLQHFFVKIYQLTLFAESVMREFSKATLMKIGLFCDVILH
jgi:Laminin G domain